MTIESQSKFRWEEMEEVDDFFLDFLLPPKQVIGPDENGYQTVIDYKFNDEGNKVKITTRSKLGDAANEESGSHLTMVSTEEILMESDCDPKQVIGPDENGFQTVIDYKFNDEGNKVKITTRSKFGDAANEESGSHLTMVSTEEILMESDCDSCGTKADESEAAGDSFLFVVCRICNKKDDHWTSKCPRNYPVFMDKPPTGETSTNTAAPGGTGRATPRP